MPKLFSFQKFSGTMELLYDIIEEVNSKLRTKQAAPTQPSMKYSQSYQDMKANSKPHSENGPEYLATSCLSAKTLTKTIDKNRKSGTVPHQKKSKKTGPNNPRQPIMMSSNSMYMDSASMNGTMLEQTTSNGSYLMTQSLIEDSPQSASSVTPQTNVISKEQVSSTNSLVLQCD